jgi:hypothetical protein
MSNNKQSSIDFLIDWMSKNEYFIGNDLLKEIEKAKAMHKEETCQFVSDYLDDADYGMTAEEYYDQIYGGNNERMV